MIVDIWTNVESKFPMILQRLNVTGSKKSPFFAENCSTSLTFCHKCITQCTITTFSQNWHKIFTIFTIFGLWSRGKPWYSNFAYQSHHRRRFRVRPPYKSPMTRHLYVYHCIYLGYCGIHHTHTLYIIKVVGMASSLVLERDASQ